MTGVNEQHDVEVLYKHTLSLLVVFVSRLFSVEEQQRDEELVFTLTQEFTDSKKLVPHSPQEGVIIHTHTHTHTVNATEENSF